MTDETNIEDEWRAVESNWESLSKAWDDYEQLVTLDSARTKHAMERVEMRTSDPPEGLTQVELDSIVATLERMEVRAWFVAQIYHTFMEKGFTEERAFHMTMAHLHP